MPNEPLPPCEGEFRIAADGQWWHDGRPIERVALARLFSTILYDKGALGYWLETPVERCPVAVEDLPFLAVEAQWEEGTLRVNTSLGVSVMLDAEHPWENDGKGPRIRIRDGLWARVARPLYYRLVEEALAQPQADAARLEIVSAGKRFLLGAV